MNAIETQRLTKDFGGGKGILDLDLKVPERRVHGFLGPNGAGKTTTIRLLLDLLRPQRGHARVLGRDPRLYAADLRAEIGYVPGELALPGNLTGARYLADSAELHGGVDVEHRDRLIERLGAQVGPRIRTLSKGNKQKIALVDALQHAPQLLIMDEPTDGLDPLLRDEVRQLLRAHVRAGGTVFLSSHVVHEIQTMCDDVSIVLSGRLRVRARIADLIAAEPARVTCRVPDVERAARLLGQAGARDLKRRGDRLAFAVVGDLLPTMTALAGARATDVRVRQGDLEELFLRTYREERP